MIFCILLYKYYLSFPHTDCEIVATTYGPSDGPRTGPETPSGSIRIGGSTTAAVWYETTMRFYVCSVINPDCTILITTTFPDPIAELDMEGTHDFTVYVDAQIKEASAVEGYLVCASVNGMGAFANLTDSTTTTSTAFLALLATQGFSYDTSTSNTHSQLTTGIGEIFFYSAVTFIHIYMQ